MPPGNRIDFKFADGLRFLAALAVALYHAYSFTGHSGDTAGLPRPLKVFAAGNLGVPVFIVLSGFVLMLPVARSGSLRLTRGFWTYVRRRARRILPPCYAALLLFVVMIHVVPVMSRPSDTDWDSKIPVTTGGVVAHLFMVQNLSSAWVYQIDGPAWSVATEWQLYFALPLLMLPLWRRIGAVPTVLVAIVLGVAVSRGIPQLSQAHFWLLGLFAMGALAAYATVNAPRIEGLGAALAVATPIFAVAVAVANSQLQARAWASETALGAIVAGLLIWLGQRSLADRPTWAHRLLENRLLVWGGLWSYSIYLIHSPFLALGDLLLVGHGIGTGALLALMVVVVLPCALALAYLFHHLVERHFLTSHQRVEIAT